jgi:uncharacterized protein (UPF0548 family)
MQLLSRHRPAAIEMWESRPFWPGSDRGPGPGDRCDDFERKIAVEAPGAPVPGGPFERAARAILSYRVFPPELIEGVLRRTPVEVGDTVGIRYHAPLGADLFFAARVVARFVDRREGALNATGFTYRTLVGHPELGEETFAVEKDVDTGNVYAALRSWSRPGTRLARAGAPLLRRIQVRANERALDHLERVAGGR